MRKRYLSPALKAAARSNPDSTARVAAVYEALQSGPAPGETRRGVPADYAGDDPDLCNARTKSGRPCRAMGLWPNGRCKKHSGPLDEPKSAPTKSVTMFKLHSLREQLVLSVEVRLAQLYARRR